MRLVSILRAITLLTVAGLGTAFGNPVGGYPNKPITLIVPFPPGNVSDLMARTVAAKLSASWRQPVVVENIGGASGVIGFQKAARAVPDGYTVTMGAVGVGIIVPLMLETPPYDIVKDFIPVTLAAPVPLMLLVHPDVPAQSVKELLELARARPGQLSYASIGIGSSQHLAMEIFTTMTKINMVHVPYKGSAQANTDLLANRVQVMFDAIPPALQRVRAGKLRAIAVSSSKRSAIAPDMPTVEEAGVPGYEMTPWTGFFVPAGTPPEIVAKLNAELVIILKSPEVKKRLIASGLETAGTSQAEFAAFIKKERTKWADVLKAAGVIQEK